MCQRRIIHSPTRSCGDRSGHKHRSGTFPRASKIPGKFLLGQLLGHLANAWRIGRQFGAEEHRRAQRTWEESPGPHKIMPELWLIFSRAGAFTVAGRSQRGPVSPIGGAGPFAFQGGPAAPAGAPGRAAWCVWCTRKRSPWTGAGKRRQAAGVSARRRPHHEGHIHREPTSPCRPRPACSREATPPIRVPPRLLCFYALRVSGRFGVRRGPFSRICGPQRTCGARAAKKRPFGTFFARFWTKKSGSFDSHIRTKIMNVFVDHSVAPQVLLRTPLTEIGRS